jgi:transcriptional regulator with XRE-family HTH domain
MATMLQELETFDIEPTRDQSRIGIRIKHTRMTRGLTLRDLATKVGCSVSALSKIENRKANPSITMLHRICSSLGTNMASLFAEDENNGHVVTRAEKRPLIPADPLHDSPGTQRERLAPCTPGNLLQGCVFIIEPGGHSKETMQHQGEELGYIVEGVLELSVDNQTYHAEAGDSFFFRSDQPHSYRNPGDTSTRVIWVSTPPSF